MAELKDAWIKTAKSFVLAANDLVIALGDSIKVGREKVMDWAQSDGEYVQTEYTDIHEEDDDKKAE